MNERQQKLLKIITSQYIKTAEPVSSKFIAEAGNFDLSPATIRNEMAELEDQGYISHPHTSAGRMPTEKGYRFFADNFISEIKPGKKQQALLEEAVKAAAGFQPPIVKQLAKELAELSDSAVFVAFADNDFYYTGLSNMFSQPEFAERELVCNLSRMIDRLDEVVKNLFASVRKDVEIVIGSDNPFGKDCSSILTKYERKDSEGLLGIIGPTRMDYQNNFNLVRYSRELINNLK